MNLLHIIGSMDPTTGGPCQVICNLVPEMKKLGVHNEVVSLDDPSAPFITGNIFPIHALGPSTGPWCYSSKLIPWLLQNLHRFDAVIVHGLWLYHGYALSKSMQLLKRKRRANQQIMNDTPRLFIIPHGMLDPYFQRATDRKLKAVRNWIYWKLIEGKVINGADGILFTCEVELQLARVPFHPYNPRREINIGIGIADVPSYLPSMGKAFLAKCPQLQNTPYLLFLSRIHEKKGVDLLIDAYSKLKKRSKEVYADNEVKAPGVERTSSTKASVSEVAKLVIAGPGLETPYGQKIQKMVLEDPNLHGSVFFPGMLTHDAKWGAFYGSEAFVLPSHQENFGIAVVEAMACGKPVLISKQVNIWREIKEAGAGNVADDTVEGAQELLEYWNDLSDSQKMKMGYQARKSFLKYFSVSPAANRLKEAINNSLYPIA